MRFGQLVAWFLRFYDQNQISTEFKPNSKIQHTIVGDCRGMRMSQPNSKLKHIGTSAWSHYKARHVIYLFFDIKLISGVSFSILDSLFEMALGFD